MQPLTWVSYRVYGDSIGLISTKGSDRGRAKIYIDGKYVKTIDTYSSSYRPRQLVFYRSWKTSKTRYIRIENLGTPGRSRFDIDGLALGNSSTPFSLAGRGSRATRSFKLGKGLATFNFTHAGESNFAARVVDDRGHVVALVANEIGSARGSKALHIKHDGRYLLKIDADGAWNVEVAQPWPKSGHSIPVILSGRGQRATQFVWLSAGRHEFMMSHDGASNFIALLLDQDGQIVDLLVKEIGQFNLRETVVSIPRSGYYLVDVSADGKWEVGFDAWYP